MAREQTEDYLETVRALLRENAAFLGERERGDINV